MLPLDGVPQFVALFLSMSFSAYTAQFLNRIDELIAKESTSESVKELARSYRKHLRKILAVFIVSSTTIFFRIFLWSFGKGHLFLDLAVISLLLAGHILLTYVSYKSYW